MKVLALKGIVQLGIWLKVPYKRLKLVNDRLREMTE